MRCLVCRKEMEFSGYIVKRPRSIGIWYSPKQGPLKPRKVYHATVRAKNAYCFECAQEKCSKMNLEDQNEISPTIPASSFNPS